MDEKEKFQVYRMVRKQQMKLWEKSAMLTDADMDRAIAEEWTVLYQEFTKPALHE